MSRPGKPARSGVGRTRAVSDALASLNRNPDILARPDYEPFSFVQDDATGLVRVTTADTGRFHAMLRAVTDEGGFDPGAVFERLLEAEIAEMHANPKVARRSPAEVRRRLAQRVNPYLYLGNKPADVLAAFDKVLEVRPPAAS